MQSRQESGLRALLVGGPTPDQNLSETWLIDDCGIEGWRRPLRRIDLLHVIHVVNPDSARRTHVEGGKDARMPIGGNFGDLLEAGVAQHLHHHAAAFFHAAILGGNRGLAYPGLQALQSFIMALLDLRPDGVEVGIVSKGKPGHCRSRRSHQTTAKKVSTIHGRSIKERGTTVQTFAKRLELPQIPVR